MPQDLDTLLNYLRAKGIPHDEILGQLVINDNLDVSGDDVTWLPDGMVVVGSLRLKNSTLVTLPETMKVMAHLSVKGSPMTSLPASLDVGVDITLSRTHIRTLPDNLRVGGSLDLNHNPMDALPEGLSVRHHLDVRHTGLERLPARLSVGSYIQPPDTLVDITTFMSDRTGSVMLTKLASHHARMELAHLPDLTRVLDSMRPHVFLRIERTSKGAIKAEFIRAD